jgi:argininosuccinate lyase
MEYLIRRGIPQRTAHHVSGSLVAEAMSRGIPLSELSLADFRRADSSLDEDVYQVLGAANAVEAFTSYGSTASTEVDRQIQGWRSRLQLKQVPAP